MGSENEELNLVLNKREEEGSASSSFSDSHFFSGESFFSEEENLDEEVSSLGNKELFGLESMVIERGERRGRGEGEEGGEGGESGEGEEGREGGVGEGGERREGGEIGEGGEGGEAGEGGERGEAGERGEGEESGEGEEIGEGGESGEGGERGEGKECGEGGERGGEGGGSGAEEGGERGSGGNGGEGKGGERGEERGEEMGEESVDERGESGESRGRGGRGEREEEKETGGKKKSRRLETYSSSESDDDTFWDAENFAEKTTKKKLRKSLQVFLDGLDSPSNEDLENEKQNWKCLVCEGGPGKTQWWGGLRKLTSHLLNKTQIWRPEEHREFGLKLVSKLEERGVKLFSGFPKMEEICSRSKGVQRERFLQPVVWPPMVLVVNTHLYPTEDGKWVGISNKELEEYFRNYRFITRFKQSWGEEGHRGKSLLIFEARHEGYNEAIRLCFQFCVEGRGRDSWIRKERGFLFDQNKRPKFYGWMATMEDIRRFNQYFRKPVEAEIQDWGEVVEEPMRQAMIEGERVGFLEIELISVKERVRISEGERERLEKEVEDLKGRLVSEREWLEKEFETVKRELEGEVERGKGEVERMEGKLERKEREVEEVRRRFREMKKMSEENVEAMKKEFEEQFEYLKKNCGSFLGREEES